MEPADDATPLFFPGAVFGVTQPAHLCTRPCIHRMKYTWFWQVLATKKHPACTCWLGSRCLPTMCISADIIWHLLITNGVHIYLTNHIIRHIVLYLLESPCFILWNANDNSAPWHSHPSASTIILSHIFCWARGMPLSGHLEFQERCAKWECTAFHSRPFYTI